jgi:hypothetical protein
MTPLVSASYPLAARQGSSGSIPLESVWLGVPQIPIFSEIQSPIPVYLSASLIISQITCLGHACSNVRLFLLSLRKMALRHALAIVLAMNTLTIRPDTVSRCVQSLPNKLSQTIPPICVSRRARRMPITMLPITRGSVLPDVRAIQPCMPITPLVPASTTVPKASSTPMPTIPPAGASIYVRESLTMRIARSSACQSASLATQTPRLSFVLQSVLVIPMETIGPPVVWQIVLSTRVGRPMPKITTISACTIAWLSSIPSETFLRSGA